MTEKACKDWIQTEYLKKKKTTIEALRSLSVEQLTKHIKSYKEFIVTFVEENDVYIQKAQIQEHVEKQLLEITALEKILEFGITDRLVNVMLEEEVIVHVIEKTKKGYKKFDC
ncbi:conserved hypothetical protein [Alteracholeplasma palmae J233]|uniref:Uncharacterized protein n=1 Tax=Alteracholeplasma palmae (strain ATCC 49389 / J233) TaxID=1318466 RepID=U4KKU4_ALTPJ|nr:hypothetical protein [Alteracholeplasma palmae]CCV64317.1 conserved hypothetical protein [Alteracholeplasma palmae J233]